MITESPVRAAATPGALSRAEVASYEAEGYLIVRGVFRPDEVADLAADVDRVCRQHHDLIDANNLRVRFKPHRATNDPKPTSTSRTMGGAHPRVVARCGAATRTVDSDQCRDALPVSIA